MDLCQQPERKNFDYYGKKLVYYTEIDGTDL